jgi:iron complex outermembrane recepter protein
MNVKTKRFLLLCSVSVVAANVSSAPALAQDQQLPQINVTDTRLQGTSQIGGNTWGGVLTGTAGIVGTSTTVITAEDIERSPTQTLPDILSREPGVQVQNLFGGVNAARSTIDMRGFGAAAQSNTLLLINGRRVNDLDLVGFDLASIPRESIERIEITRGNSGVVLYGDGAMGGVINIITKNGVGAKPAGRIDGAFGSFGYREGNASYTGSNGPWSASIHSNVIASEGYRKNNEYNQQNGVGDFRYSTNEGSLYLNLSADDQGIGLPGHRRVEPAAGINKMLTERQGAFSPYDWAAKQGQNVTLGFTRMLAPGWELIVDGGVRRKEEQSQFFVTTETLQSTAGRAATDTTLTTASFTPRMKVDSTVFGMPTKGIGGFDYYRADYDSARPQILDAAPIHQFDLTQSSAAFYWQQTVSILPSTDVAAGGRIQRTNIHARDTFDPNAPGAVPFFFGFPVDTQGIPLDKSQTNHAYHLGAEHRFTENFSVFGRMAQSFRVPNVDERVGAVTGQIGIPTTFDLRTQRSHDYEGGVRARFGGLNVQWSYYDMRLTDEIHFRFGPPPNFDADNTNLDPTHRFGHETIASYTVTDNFRLKGGLAYTRAKFREGVFAGSEVPLVSKWTGNVGFSWDIWQKWLTLDTVVRYVGSRRMDNDQTNLQPLIPGHTTVDVRIGGEIDKFFWSFAVQNLFDVQYFDYAIASPYPFGFASTLGTYNAYPQPGRAYMLKAGVTW